ncbi:MAG: VWA domain-containing protein [Candidatus Omnitrophica bacterium]|nr:VWA domain-containing protein [Candidatus Omnitrophota bacterium]
MQFGDLNYAWFLLLIPGVIMLFRFAGMRKKIAEQKFADLDLVKQLTMHVDSTRVTFKKVLLVLTFTLMVLSLMQPKWGFHWEEIKRKGIDIVVALDLSKSMLAEDIKPNRLERARMEIKNLINILQGDRIGIVTFAGTSFIHCPLTLDYATAKTFLDALDTDLIPEPGTNIGGAIEKALRSFEGVDKQHQVLILITDGEDHEEKVMESVKDARSKGVIIYTIGIGSKVGAPIPITDEQGNKVYLKDRSGQVVVSKMDSEMLQKIALMTGGKNGTIGGAQFPLEDIYLNEISKMEKKELGSMRRKKYENRYQWPLAIALLLLLLEFFIPVTRRVQKRMV